MSLRSETVASQAPWEVLLHETVSDVTGRVLLCRASAFLHSHGRQKIFILFVQSLSFDVCARHAASRALQHERVLKQWLLFAAVL